MSKTKIFLISFLSMTLILFFAGTLFSPNIVAHDSDDDSCQPSQSCGTTEGARQTTVYTDYQYSCPSDYSKNNSDNWDKRCKKAEYKYSNRSFDLVCPSDDSAYNSSSHLDCKRKIHGNWKYTNKIKQYDSCPKDWEVDPNDDSKCRKFDEWEYEHPSSVSCPEGYQQSGQGSSTKCSQSKIQSCTVPFIECQSPTTTPVVTSTPTDTLTPTATPTAIPTSDPEPTTTTIPTSTPTSVPHVGGDSGGSSGGGNPGAPECNDADPGAPQNLTAFALGGGKVKLTWENSPGPHTGYAVAYGPSIGNYLYGDPNVGNVTTYTVNALSPGGQYCFYVQAQNGCKGGVPSNVICTNQPGTIEVLGASDNYNPLVEGIRDSFGGSILGASTELVSTDEVGYSNDKLPSGNTLTEDTISIPAINLNQPIYLPSKIGDVLTVGHHEVLSAVVGGQQIYYGHNGSDVFGSIYKLMPGHKIVLNHNQQNQTYTVISKQYVSKDDIDSLLTAHQDDIVLVTCSYTNPDYRIIVKASIIK